LIRALPSVDLIAVQQVNNETGVIQPDLGEAIRGRAQYGWPIARRGGEIAFARCRHDCDCRAQDWRASGHRGAAGAQFRPVSAQRRARAGLSRRHGKSALYSGPCDGSGGGSVWLFQAAVLRGWFEDELREMGGEVIGHGAERIATIGAYRLPGVNATVLIRADMAGIAFRRGRPAAAAA
jgi:cysteine desulfurase